MIRFITKKIVVDCFINYPQMAEKFNIRKSVKHTPDWWKKLPLSYVKKDDSLQINYDQNTMKKCLGFVDLYSSSWTIPMWSDMVIRTLEDGTYSFLTPINVLNNPLEAHNPEQHGYNFKNFFVMKLTSPWFLFEKKGVKFAFIGADWSLLNDYPDVRIPSGLLDFKYNNSTNINFFLPRKNAEYKFSAGTPLVHLIPLTDRRVEFKTHCVSDSEYIEVMKRTGRYRSTFNAIRHN